MESFNPSQRIQIPERQTEFQNKEFVCNWCGSKNIKLVKLVYRVFGCDSWHDIYECLDCGKHSWHHIHWSKCWQNPDGSWSGW